MNEKIIITKKKNGDTEKIEPSTTDKMCPFWGKECGSCTLYIKAGEISGFEGCCFKLIALSVSSLDRNGRRF